MTERVLVTGGSGFLAGWCVSALLDRGYEVRTTVRDPGRAPAGTEAVVADLMRDDGWAAAAEGCDYVLHVASPVLTGDTDPTDPHALVGPAREGTLRVLRAAVAAKVRRVVVTSSAAAASAHSSTPDAVTDETLWTDPDDPVLTPYRRAKPIAERAAWDFIAEHGGATELSTVLPGWVLGPVQGPLANLGSLRLVDDLLAGRMPGLPRVGVEVVDVRDIADLHVRAMTDPAAAGERFLGTGPFLWMAEIAEILRERLGEDAARVPTQPLPDEVIRHAATTDPDLGTLIATLGHKRIRSSAKAHRLLGWTTRPAPDAVEASARTLLQSVHR
ncbi:dihydroflavonol-4-reductase [Virgisporangium aliadipatigenens]|uniref:Dihydroflavonol-4-reductase n=1 Tax=Virgisporangium aliadipatigenens TaxID=741659 RepID=A0A8J3YJD3_9ACTN|nr:NAD-dependent epimerase/dehydratase family protein [Virgisporangium aliadipatigenens]GIJ45367.1 dihydroflavonol-4-reductase [Virgisporangium aliadipatigenens]